MKNLRLLIALAGLTAVTACSHAPPVVNHVVDAIIDCGAPKIHDLAIQLIPTVETIVAKRGDGWQSDLEALIATNAEEAVACALQRVLTTAFSATKAAPSDTLSNTKATRSNAFIVQKGYKFKDSP